MSLFQVVQNEYNNILYSWCAVRYGAGHTAPNEATKDAEKAWAAWIRHEHVLGRLTEHLKTVSRSKIVDRGY